MKNLMLIILVLTANFAHTQIEKKSYKVVMTEFEQNYNSENYKEIFSMFSSDMQQALPLEKTLETMEMLKTQLGNIIKREFIKYQQEKVAVYKTEFEKAVHAIEIVLDTESKINGLYFRPYVANNYTETKNINIINSQDKKINKEISDLIFNHSKKFPEKTQVSIAIIDNGNIKYYGAKRENDTIISIDNHNKAFEIGSISKVFTSTLLANFVQDKKLALDDDISDYIKTPLKDEVQITFKELASHHSGLPRLPTNLDLTKVNSENPYQKYSDSKLQEYLSNELNQSEKKYQYSNLGAGLLGYILTKIDNKNYQDLLQTYIAAKFDMKNTTVIRDDIENILVKGLNAQGNETANWDLAVLMGAGGILSTVEDLAKFATAHFNNNNHELTLTRTKTFQASMGMDIGLGWHIIKKDTDKNLFWHNGGTGGYSSSMIMFPKKKTAVIILSNVSAFNENMANIDGLSFGLMKLISTNK